jgi:hypothetical protein
MRAITIIYFILSFLFLTILSLADFHDVCLFKETLDGREEPCNEGYYQISRRIECPSMAKEGESCCGG